MIKANKFFATLAYKLNVKDCVFVAEVTANGSKLFKKTLMSL